jgi:hypothetical protein
MPPPLVLSLFPGIGLLDMAFEEEGFCVVRGPDLLWGSVPTSLAGQGPDGYVLVPIEPTDEMYRAALRVTRDPENGHIADHVGGAVYRAMLFAAPQPTAGRDADAK